MLTDFLGVRRGLPDIPRVFDLRLVFFPTAVARYQADRYAVAFGPAVRVVGAIGVEGILNRQVPDFAMVGQRVVSWDLTDCSLLATFRTCWRFARLRSTPSGWTDCGTREIVILLAGGDKRTQIDDVKTALRLARNL